NVVAVWISATYMGPAPRETMSHAAPTACMNVPTSEATSARSRLRNIGVRNGRHRLRVGCWGDVGICCHSLNAGAVAGIVVHFARAPTRSGRGGAQAGQYRALCQASHDGGGATGHPGAPHGGRRVDDIVTPLAA